MYACTLENGRGFFEGVHALSDQACISSDPPHPAIRGSLHACSVCLSRILPLTAVNVYSLLQYLVLSDKLKGVEIGYLLLP